MIDTDRVQEKGLKPPWTIIFLFIVLQVFQIGVSEAAVSMCLFQHLALMEVLFVGDGHSPAKRRPKLKIRFRLTYFFQPEKPQDRLKLMTYVFRNEECV